jgi:AraC-like DNA-binding protein
VIAKEAGFGSPEHMRFSFKQHMHMTPGEYRRENR